MGINPKNQQQMTKVDHNISETTSQIIHPTNASQMALNAYKPIIVTMQYVQNKERWFSSKCVIDPLLRPFFIELFTNAEQNAEIYSRSIVNLEYTTCADPGDALIFKKQLMCENFVVLQVLQLLYTKGIIDAHMRPNEQEIRNLLYNQFSKISKLTMNESHNQALSSSSSNASKSTKISTNDGSSLDSHPLQSQNFFRVRHIIQQIINPLIIAIKKYNQNQQFALRWSQNNKVDTVKRIKNLKDRTKYSKEMELFATNFFGKNEFIELVKLFDESVDSLILPKHWTQHLHYNDERDSHRYFFLCQLIIALSEKVPQNEQYDLIKQEIGRLAFIGDQAITLNAVMFLYFTQDGKMQEKNMDQLKIKMINQDSIIQKATAWEFTHSLIKCEESKSGPQNLEKDLHESVQCFAGFLSLYIGVDASMLFLRELNVIGHETQQAQSKVDGMIEFLEFMSLKRTEIINKRAEQQEKVAKFMSHQGMSVFKNPEQKFPLENLINFVERSTCEVEFSTQSTADTGEIEVTIARKGYIFRNITLPIQATTHVSFSTELLLHPEYNPIDSPDSIENYSQYFENFTFQLLEYLGDPILNFTVAKLFYFETASASENWHKDYFKAMKLHDLKIWFTSNNWLAFLIYEHYYYSRMDIPQELEEACIRYNKSKEPSDKEIILSLMPRLPLFYSDANSQYHQQLLEYQFDLTRRFAMAKKNAKNIGSLSLSCFQHTEDDDSDYGFLEMQGNYVKYFADVHEALIGAIFLDSGDFKMTAEIVLLLLKSRYIDVFPLVENERSKTLSIWNSKKYNKDLKLTHTIEERKEDVVMRGHIDTTEVRRVKFKTDQKNKVANFYRDLRKYLETAYYKFEMKHYKELTTDKSIKRTWLEFNREFRKIYNIKDSTKDQGYLHKIAKNLYQRVEKTTDEKQQREYLRAAIKSIPKDDFLMVNLEHERVRVSHVRGLWNKADIRWLSQFSSYEELLERMNDKQMKALFQGLQAYGEEIISQKD